MSYILNDPSLLNASEETDEKQFCTRYPKHQKLDCTAYENVCDMANKQRCTSGDFIKQKVQIFDAEANRKLPTDKLVNLKFSKGWLESLKQRWGSCFCAATRSIAKVEM